MPVAMVPLGVRVHACGTGCGTGGTSSRVARRPAADGGGTRPGPALASRFRAGPAIRTLQHRFHSDIRTQDERIRSGMYAWLRHPSRVEAQPIPSWEWRKDSPVNGTSSTVFRPMSDS